MITNPNPNPKPNPNLETSSNSTTKSEDLNMVVLGCQTPTCLMCIMFDVTLHQWMLTTATTVQCDVYANFVRSYLEVVKSLSYCSRK